MEKEKVEIGTISPTYQQVGWRVCKDPEKDKWIDVEKYSEAEMLSFIYKNKKKPVKKPKKIQQPEEEDDFE